MLKEWIDTPLPTKRLFNWVDGMKRLDPARGGTAIHKLFEMALAVCNKPNFELDDLIESHRLEVEDECIYPPLDNWRVFVSTLVEHAKNYLTKYSRIESEITFKYGLLKGKIDAIADDVVIELKSGKPDIKQDLAQALHYVYLARKSGKTINSIHIIYLTYDKPIVTIDVRSFDHLKIGSYLLPVNKPRPKVNSLPAKQAVQPLPSKKTEQYVPLMSFDVEEAPRGVTMKLNTINYNMNSQPTCEDWLFALFNSCCCCQQGC